MMTSRKLRLELFHGRANLAGAWRFLLLLSICSTIWSQTAQVRQNALPPAPLEANDLIEVSIYNAEELTVKVRVNRTGDITLPMLSEPVAARGLLPAALGRDIEAAYKEAGILVNPKVTVSLLELASKPVSVLGAVNSPVTFQADRPVSLPEAITRAGGLSPNAGSYILISRPIGGDTDLKAATVRIEVDELLQSADSAVDITLTGGEEVRVPLAGKIYVVGNVRKPGSFQIPDDQQTSVLKALALSEGLQPNSEKIAYIYRKAENGEKTEIPVKLRDVLARRSPDVTLLRDDVLYVPESAKKKAAMSAIERALAFGTATLSGVLVWGVAR